MTKKIRFKDLLDPFVFLLILPVALVHRIYCKVTKKQIILISEDPNEACDNGYEFFRYLVDKENRSNVYYAINKNSVHRKKFKKTDDLINFGGVIHWIYFINAHKNISIHKASSPAPALFYVLIKLKLFNGNRVFLQHGVTMNYVEYLDQRKCHFILFTTVSEFESDYIVEKLHYTRDVAKDTGFARYDRLFNCRNTFENQIAIMPTWRSYYKDMEIDDFVKTDYYLSWQSLLNSNEFADYLQKNNKKAYFYLHRNFQKYSHLFATDCTNIRLSSVEDTDIQELITNSSQLITDYSSVSIDFGFMMRPVYYFQFDFENFREKHLSEGYFSYEKNGFGPVSKNLDKLLCDLENEESERQYYAERSDAFFKYIDNKNCERISTQVFKEIN